MHTILKVTMNDVATANEVIMSGRIREIFDQTAKFIAPEASYFFSEHGYRTALYVFDLKDASLIPQILEPFYTELNAMAELFPVMDANELGQGLGAWQGHDKLSEKSIS